METRGLLIASLLFLVASCQKHHDTIRQPEIAQVAGIYSGTYSTNLVPAKNITVTLSQNLSFVQGTFVGAGGSLQGSVIGTAGESGATLALSETSPCAGDFTAILTLNGNLLTGTVKGQDCLGTHSSGIFEVTR